MGKIGQVVSEVSKASISIFSYYGHIWTLADLSGIICKEDQPRILLAKFWIKLTPWIYRTKDKRRQTPSDYNSSIDPLGQVNLNYDVTSQYTAGNNNRINISKNGVNVITSLISQLNTPRNVVESGVKHHKPNHTTSFLKIKKKCMYTGFYSHELTNCIPRK